MLPTMVMHNTYANAGYPHLMLHMLVLAINYACICRDLIVQVTCHHCQNMVAFLVHTWWPLVAGQTTVYNTFTFMYIHVCTLHT